MRAVKRDLDPAQPGYMDSRTPIAARLEQPDRVKVPVVDLFAGCGGLSLGFELADEDLDFHVVMALDNDQGVVRCFNDNHPAVVGAGPIGRVADLTWFNHPSEVLLYYLVHRSTTDVTGELLKQLNAPGIEWSGFLGVINGLDAQFARDLEELARSVRYQESMARVDKAAFTLAISKSFFTRIGLSSLSRGQVNRAALPWGGDGSNSDAQRDADLSAIGVIPLLHASAEQLWDDELAKLVDAAAKVGRGQHRTVNSRLGTMVAFLSSDTGQELRQLWIEWRARRDSVRASRCLAMYPALQRLYDGDLRVRLILGGPPCKGFSRIGRAVMRSLRAQGASAWTSKEYGDERNALMHKYVLFLEALQPDAFIFENVAHFASSLRTPAGKLDAADALKEAIAGLSGNSAHYEVQSQIVRAREHAVPQDRERFIMVGFNATTTAADSAAKAFFQFEKFDDEVPLILALQGLDSPSEFVFGSTGGAVIDRSRAYTLVDQEMPKAHVRYVEWIRQASPGASVAPAEVDAHVVRRGRADDAALVKRLAPGQRWMDLKIRSSPTMTQLRQVLQALATSLHSDPSSVPVGVDEVDDLLSKVNDSLLLRLMLEDVAATLPPPREHHLLSEHYLGKGADAHGDWLERLNAHKPCKTIVAHIGKDNYGYFHPYEPRAISMREAARVQSFPDWFKFGSAGVVSGYSMIGNAVPPLLANSFARRFGELHRLLGIFDSPSESVNAAG